MKKLEGLSIIAMTLLIFQLLGPNLGIMADAKSMEDDLSVSEGEITVAYQEHTDDTITWQLDINQLATEHDGLQAEILLDENQQHTSITEADDIDIVETTAGYTLEITPGNTHHTLEIITTKKQAATVYTLTAQVLDQDEILQATATFIPEDVAEESPNELQTSELEKNEEDIEEGEANEKAAEMLGAINLATFKVEEDEIVGTDSEVSTATKEAKSVCTAVPKPEDNITELDYDQDTYSKDVRDYNAIIFGNHTFSGGETEGATAVQGDVISQGTIDYGSANRFGEPNHNQIGIMPLPEKTPGLLVGGEVKGTATIYNGVVMEDDIDSACKVTIKKGDRIYDEQGNRDQVFADFKTYITDHQATLDFFKPSTSISPNHDGTIAENLIEHFTEDPDNEKVLILNITGDTLNMKSFYFPNLDDYEKVIIYSDAREISFSSGSMLYEGGVIDTQSTFGTPANDILHGVASKVTWSFPNAETITANSYSIVGTLIAPKAHFKSTGGSLSGQAFVKDLTTGVYSFNQLRNTVEEPSPGLGQIEITKVDTEDNSIVLAGATFDIVGEDGEIVGELVTDEDGKALSERLDIGDYTLVETEAPDGYELVTEAVSVTVEKDETTEVTITNSKTPTPTGNIKIIKVDAADDSLTLQGATFNIVDAAGNVVGVLVTDEDGEALSGNLDIGDYTLVEIEAPVDYELLTEAIDVTIVKNETVEKVIINDKIPDPLGDIKLIKVDAADNSILLEDATFQLIDKDGTVLATGTTDRFGEIFFEDVVLGTYVLKETKAPEGYRILNGEVELEVTKENLSVTKVIENQKADWVIPDTGGIGALLFYGIGLLLMIGALWFVFRKRKA